MNVVAIDPGKMGAIAVRYLDGRVSVSPLKDSETDIIHQVRSAVSAATYNGASARCVIERVHAMPGGGQRKMGAVSAFNFGRSYGFLRACLLHHNIPFYEVSAQKWQSGLGIGKISGPERKRALKAIAQQRFPTANVTLRTCDAALIAEWEFLRWKEN